MKKNKGFTLVELLGVIIIIGILSVISIAAVSRLIDKSRVAQLEQQKNSLTMAAEAYMQANRAYLPKSIGESATVTASVLKEYGYLKDEIKNSKGASCMVNSIVKVTKTSKKKYKYEAFLYCGDDEVPPEVKEDEPIIKIEFIDENGKNEKENPNLVKDVAIARFKIVYKGNEEKNLSITGYSYSVLVGNNEVYSSGTLSGNRLYEIEVLKSLKDYVDITTTTKITVKAMAVNEKGGIRNYKSTLGEPSKSTTYDDDVPPICSSKKNEGSAKTWATKRSVSVTCSDGNGSGCVRDTFTKTWPNNKQKSAIYGYIQVKDNADNPSEVKGNNSVTTDICNIDYDTSDPCLVKVYVDAVAPVLKIDAFKRDASGNKTGSSVLKGATTTTRYSDDNSALITEEQYKNLTRKWGNKDNYPNGIVYTVTIEDDIHIKRWIWQTNKSNLNPDSNLNDLLKYNSFSSKNPDGIGWTTVENDHSTKNCGTRKKEITIGFTEEGKRKGTLIVEDNAGNQTKYVIEFNLDKTAPSCTNSGGDSSWRNKKTIKDGVKIKGTCGEKIGSGCYKDASKTYTNNINSTTETPGTVYDTAGNGTLCKSDRTVKIDKTEPTCQSGGGVSSWKNKNNIGDGITLTGTCHDEGGSNCDDNKNKTTAKKTYKNNINSTTESAGTVYDVAGNSGKCTSDQTVKIDITAPTCKSGGGDSSWRNKNNIGDGITLTGTCHDKGGSNCDDNKNATTAKKTYKNNINSTTESAGTVYDVAGNSGKCTSDQSVKIDITAPTCESSGGKSSWRNKNNIGDGITLTGTCHDEGGSNCDANKNATTAKKTYKNNINSTTESAGKVYDKAGNSGDCSADQTVKIDKTPPTCQSKGGEPDWRNANNIGDGVKLTGECHDKGGSNCDDNKNATTAKKTYKNNINSTKESAGTVYDVAGNSGKCTSDQTVKIDKTPPTCPNVKATSDSDGKTYNSGDIICNSVTVIGTCNDTGGSGCSQKEFSDSGTSGTITVKVYDNAGNSKNCSSITVNKGTYSASSACKCKTREACKTGSTCVSWNNWGSEYMVCPEQTTNCNKNLPYNNYKQCYTKNTSHAAGCGCEYWCKERTCKGYNKYSDPSCTCIEYNTCCHK